jgi:hypothetical protein
MRRTAMLWEVFVTRFQEAFERRARRRGSCWGCPARPQRLGRDAQVAAVRAYLNGGDWHLVGEFEEVESGRRNARPELDRALKLAQLHRVPRRQGRPAYPVGRVPSTSAGNGC